MFRSFLFLFKQFYIILFIICVFISHFVYATDYTISDGTTQTSRVTLTNSDTLTVDSGGEIDYNWPAVDADNRTFSSGTTTITNNGTIEGNCCVIDIRSSTNASIVNNGTINGKSSSRIIYANNSANTTITNNGTIKVSASNAYEVIDGDSTTGLVITNNANATISSAGDDAIAVADATNPTITNHGTITVADDNIIDADDINGITITNTGTMTATDDFGLYMRNATGTLTINNSGTISSAIYPMYYTIKSGGSATLNLTNSGTITLTDGHPYDTIALQANATVTNTGTISGGRYALTFNGTGIDVVNKGTVTGITYDFMSSTDNNLANLTNGQGGDDCVNWYGYLPTNYKIYIASASSYGKMCNAGNTWYMWGDTAFSIDPDSTLEARTYTDVFKWTASSDFASGLTGTCSCANGSFNWTLSDANGDTHWDLVVTSNDTTAPTLSSSTPADNATGVAVNANIVLTFDEAVDAESGNITIKKTSDDSTIETIDVTGAKVSGSGGTQITINPGTDWSEQTEYYVLIDASAFDDASGNSYAGISSTTAFSFTTGDETNPTLSSSSPADNDTNVKVNANIVLTFDEAVDAESGNITIKKTKDDSTVETIDVTGANISGSGGTEITVNPSDDLANGIEYYVLIDASAFDDSNGNSYAGISSTTALSFTTKYGEIFNDTIKAVNENQSSSSVQVMTQSLNRVSSRMNSIRPRSGNISSQGIDIAMDFSNDDANEVLNALYPNPLNVSGQWFDNFAIWTEGNISYGKIGETNNNLGQNIHSDGITWGLDKKINNNKVIGLAFNRAWQEVTVGNEDATMDTDSSSVISYGSFELKDKTFIDAVLGYGDMEIDLVRKVTDGQNTGNRKGQQLFGSITYLIEPINEDFNISISPKKFNYYSRLDIGYTALDHYSEGGNSSTAVHYNKQHIKNGSLSLGVNMSNNIEVEKGILIPHFQFEFGGDATNNSLSEAYYLTNTSDIYTHAMSDRGTWHTKFAMGIEVQYENNLNISLSYDRFDGSNSVFMNTISINLRKIF